MHSATAVLQVSGLNNWSVCQINLLNKRPGYALIGKGPMADCYNLLCNIRVIFFHLSVPVI